MKTPITQNNFVVPYHVHNGVDSPVLNTLTAGNAPTYFTGSTPWAGATFTPGATAGVQFTVTGARFGDFVIGAYSSNLQGLFLSAYVIATDLVTVEIVNNGMASPTIPAGTFTALVIVYP